MRRFLIIIGILLPMIFFSACENGSVINNERPELKFTSDLVINSEKMQVTANIVRDSEGIIKVDITSPETLRGFQIKHGKSENFITKDGLTYKTDQFILPGCSDITTIIEALDYMADNVDEGPFYKDGKEMVFIGKIDAGKFELKADRKFGLITSIKVGEKTEAKFSNQEKLTS